MKKYRFTFVPKNLNTSDSVSKTNLGTRFDANQKSRYEDYPLKANQESRYEVRLQSNQSDTRCEVRLRNAILILISFISITLSANDLLTLKGQAVQGGFLIGEISEEVEKIFWNYEDISIFDGKFIRGFDRDEKLRHTVTIVEVNGDMHNVTIRLSTRQYKIQKITKMKKKYVKQPDNPELSKRIQNESALLKTARKSIYNNQFHYFEKFMRPIEGGWISGVFGSQRVINGTPKRPHNGLDIAVPEGTEIKAMSSGIVTITGDFFYNGKFVLIDHGVGLSSVYLHLSKIDVKKGDYVIAGDKIGEVGSTGRSTGNHLHWGVNWYKKRIDPEVFLKMDEVFLKLRKDNSTK